MSERIQHRGLEREKGQELPNSFEGFRERYDQPIELDVFLLMDGEIAVVHNADLKASQEEVEAMTLPQLEERTGRPVPRFEELLLGNLDRGNALMIELKASRAEKAIELAHRLVERISALSQNDRTFAEHPEYLSKLRLFSFSAEALEEAGTLMKEGKLAMTRGLAWTSSPERALEMRISEAALARSGYQEGDDWIEKGIEMAHELGVESLDLHWSSLTKEIVDAIHAKGLRVSAWVVNDENKMHELESWGVDRIITEN